jgi:hypothetical protein
MALDTNGALLEGIRLANANNVFNFPPRDLVTDSVVFDAISDRAEYSVLAGSATGTTKSTDIGDSDLRFNWTRNEGSVLRFMYDGFSQKWLPSPGAPPDVLGVISNSPRLVTTIPDIDVLDAPFKLFIGAAARVVTFTIQVVGTAGDFGSPATGTVQLALDSGQLNFSFDDLVIFDGQVILSQRQSFFNRTRFTGRIGSLPLSNIDYFIHLNPLPATGQIPRIRIDYRAYLTPIEVADESSLGSPAAGTFTWALDTGRIRISPTDLSTNFGKPIYYDGVHNASLSLTRVTLGTLTQGWPSVGFTNATFVGITDPVRLIVFAELSGIRSYFTVRLVTNATLPSQQPLRNQCFVNTDTGQLFFNNSDVTAFSTWIFHFVDSILEIDLGVSIQFYRSAVNTGGISVVADFTIKYFVEDQIIADGIGPFPFAQLPTNPVIDDDLKYVVAVGPSSSGTFVGELVDADDPAEQGFGYSLNLDQKQLRFTERVTVTKTVQTPTPVIKLDNAVINPFGFEITKNGVPITPGVDFEFDTTTGQLIFLEPVGVDVTSDIHGSVVAPDTFFPNDIVFNISNIGQFLFITSGNNQGVYQIVELIIGGVRVSPAFAVNEALVIADLVTGVEIIIDNFWVPIIPNYRKIHIAKTSDSGNVPDFDDFTIFPTISQINLDFAADPGDVFETDYYYFAPGATTSTVVTGELSLFKVRLEPATTTSGSNVIEFNAAGRAVSEARPIEINVNGITQAQGTFQFEAPNKLFLQIPIQAGQIVTVTYWVNGATGGETSYQLLNSPMDVDIIQVAFGQTSLVLNGNHQPTIFAGSVLLAVSVDQVIVVSSVDYDSTADQTTLTFETPCTFNSGVSESFLVSSKSIFPERVTETAVSEPILQTQTGLVFAGQVFGYDSGTIVTLDSESYKVISSAYASNFNTTTVTVSVPFFRNYINPVIQRSIRPISFPEDTFQTDSSANLAQGFTLVRMGSDPKILVRDVDYRVSEGGVIELNEQLSGTDSLYAIYVSNQNQLVGDVFVINYSYLILPDDVNGLAGQRLLATYNLFSPDNYFYRVETVQTFLPEVQDLLRQSSQSSGVSGPNTGDAVGRTNKDEGSPSPYFDEQHLYNLDFSIVQLLKFYNDLVNYYEDLLSNIDGRIVGGQHGRFRFDGNLDNPVRNTYAEVTNDLDDRLLLYTKKVLTGFFTFTTIPVYVSMSDYNANSRVFSIKADVNAAINNLVGAANRGQILGTLGIEAITGFGNFVSAPATAFFNSATVVGATTKFDIAANGDVDNLVPPFAVGSKASVYSNVGTLELTATVTAITATSVTVGVAANTEIGSIARNVSDPNDSTVSRYKTNVDIGINAETGEIVNITTTLPPPATATIAGNEILAVALQYNNKETAPARAPVFDGSEHNDYGFFPVPRLRREGETVLFAKEILHLNALNTATVNSPAFTVINISVPAEIGDSIRFIDGPNAGVSRTILVPLVPGSQYLMTAPYPFACLNNNAERILNDGTRLNTTLSAELGIMETNVAGTPIGSLVTIDSELITVGNLVHLMGIELGTGTGTPISSTVFEDPGANFSLNGVDNQSFLFISSGLNVGIYKVASATATQITVEVDAIYLTFPSVGVSGSYFVFDIETFISTNGLDVLTPYLRSLLAFITSTKAWQAAPTTAGKTTRVNALTARTIADSGFIDDISDLLIRTDQFYDTRFLWIQQRADKKTGLLTQRNQAILKRQESLVKIVDDQKKLLIVESL